MSLTRDEIVERGRREWEEKSEHDRDWRGWLHIGEALDVGRREVENRIANRSRSGTPARFKGRPFNERFGLWLSENGFKDLGGKKYAATRSHLMDCLENRAAIEAWRKSLQGYQRTAWNHPTTVLRHWKKHLADEQEEARIAAGGERAPKQPSPLAKANEAIRNLIDENDRLREASREGDLFKWGEGHERIAKVLVADALANGCSPDKIRSIANGMLRELKATTFVPKETPTRRRKRDSNVKTQKAEDVMVVTTPPSNDPASEMHRLHEILFYGDMSRDDLHTQHDIADAIVDQAIAAGYVSDVDSLVKSIAPLGTSAPDSKHSTGDRQHEKIRRVLQAAGKEGMTGAALYNKGGFYDATLEAAVSAGAIRKEGDRYFAPPSHPAT